jgi:hypothetical protein
MRRLVAGDHSPLGSKPNRRLRWRQLGRAGRHSGRNSGIAQIAVVPRLRKRCGFRRLRCRGDPTLRVGLQNRKPRYEILGLIRGPLVGHTLGTEEIGSQRRRDLAIKT